MRSRIALQKHFVRNLQAASSVLRKLSECGRVLASLWLSEVHIHLRRLYYLRDGFVTSFGYSRR
jgi:hypothetical protein